MLFPPIKFKWPNRSFHSWNDPMTGHWSFESFGSFQVICHHWRTVLYVLYVLYAKIFADHLLRVPAWCANWPIKFVNWSTQIIPEEAFDFDLRFDFHFDSRFDFHIDFHFDSHFDFALIFVLTLIFALTLLALILSSTFIFAFTMTSL